MENYEFEELHRLYLSLIPLLQKCKTLHNNNDHADDFCNKNQIMAIMVIGKAESITPTALSKFINMEKGSLTTLVDSLEKKDYVQRFSDPSDRRKILLSLTAKGIKQMRIIEAQSQTVFAAMITNLDSSEIDEMYIGLKSLTKILKKISSSNK
jgi:DNA-binding MarR family transcriptional regulator